MRQETRNYYAAISRLAAKRNLTMADVERKAGLSKGIINKWRVSSPSVDKLIKVADALNITVNRIIKEADLQDDKE